MTLNTFDNELVTGYRSDRPIPERSRLFSLAPVEFPVEQRESLISLLVRTCAAHSLNPRRVVAEVLGKAKPELEPLAYPKFFNRMAGTINGHGKYASLFVSVLEASTGQRGLSRLTLLPGRTSFPTRDKECCLRPLDGVRPVSWSSVEVETMFTFRCCGHCKPTGNAQYITAHCRITAPIVGSYNPSYLGIRTRPFATIVCVR